MVHAKMNSTEDNERCTTLKMVLRFVCSVLILGGPGLELRNGYMAPKSHFFWAYRAAVVQKMEKQETPGYGLLN